MYELAGHLKASYNLDHVSFPKSLAGKVAELLSKITWQVILTALGIAGVVLTAYFLSRLGLR